MDNAIKPVHDDDDGEIAYIAYGGYVDWKNFQGAPMPQFAELPPVTQNAWRLAAASAISNHAGRNVAITDLDDEEGGHRPW